jgi:hypothetical protein
MGAIEDACIAQYENEPVHQELPVDREIARKLAARIENTLKQNPRAAHHRLPADVLATIASLLRALAPAAKERT